VNGEEKLFTIVKKSIIDHILNLESKVDHYFPSVSLAKIKWVQNPFLFPDESECLISTLKNVISSLILICDVILKKRFEKMEETIVNVVAECDILVSVACRKCYECFIAVLVIILVRASFLVYADTEA
jgi:hypothetical protein